jgi:hypothetical protein
MDNAKQERRKKQSLAMASLASHIIIPIQSMSEETG